MAPTSSLPSSPAEALRFFNQLPPSSIKLGLERIRAALEACGHPERAFRALHVAGTNGKGSTCAMAAAALRAQGHKVGLYTSPHLVRVNERIQVNGEEIPDELFGRRILEVLERSPDAAREPYPLTYFEMGTLVAFWHFAREQVDVAVIETGLGGRLDATTACEPTVTAVTSISFDHMEYLGNTLAAIAGEKAGIFKPRVPTAISRNPEEAATALRAKALAIGAPLFAEEEAFSLDADPAHPGALVYRGLSRTIDDLRLSLRGPHQRHNAATAVACLELLDRAGVPCSDDAIREGLANTRWPGRFEEIPGSPPLLLDGAHNPEGVDILLEALDALHPRTPVHAVFGVLADKAHGPMIARLFPRCASVRVAPLPSPRALAPERIVELGRAYCSDVQASPSIGQAVAHARSAARQQPGSAVLVAGSLVLVGAVKALLEMETGRSR